MADGPTQPPDDSGGNPEDGPILTPEELDIEDDEHVTKIEDGRFVVSPDASQVGEGADRDGSTPDASGSPAEGGHDAAGADQDRSPGSENASDQPVTGGAPSGDRPLTERQVHEWLERDLADSRSRYSFDVTAKFETGVSQRRMASNDVVTIFESLVLWYAQGIDRDTPVEEVLGILLMESNVPVRFPAASIQRLVRTTDLGPDDSIGDLLESVEDRDGFRL